MKIKVKNLLFDNLSYKIVSLFIALILWFTVLGRRDFQVTKNLEIDVTISAGLVLKSKSTDSIKVRVSGPRNALRKFIEGGAGQVISLDATKLTAGVHAITVPQHKLDLPFGVKLVSIKPAEVEIELLAE